MTIKDKEAWWALFCHGSACRGVHVLPCQRWHGSTVPRPVSGEKTHPLWDPACTMTGFPRVTGPIHGFDAKTRVFDAKTRFFDAKHGFWDPYFDIWDPLKPCIWPSGNPLKNPASGTLGPCIWHPGDPASGTLYTLHRALCTPCTGHPVHPVRWSP